MFVLSFLGCEAFFGHLKQKKMIFIILASTKIPRQKNNEFIQMITTNKYKNSTKKISNFDHSKNEQKRVM